MTGDLRTRVEALRDECASSGKIHYEHLAVRLTAILDAVPDTPTTDAPVDDGLVEQIARVLVEAGCNDPWHIVKRCARALVKRRPWQAEVEAARQDTLDAVIERADDGIEFGPKNCLLLTRIVTDVRDRAARGETRQP